MAQYASLSQPDPEWLKVAPSLPSFDMTDVVEFRNKLNELALKHMKTMAVGVEGSSDLFPDFGFELGFIFAAQGITVKNEEINGDGHTIPCRSYIPEIKPELGETPGQQFPLLYWSYGGGFCLGSLNDNDRMLRSLAVDLRITCVSVDYRKAPENPFPAAINDAYAGLKWALANTEDICVNVSKGVLIGGISAGGNLTAVMAHRALKDDEIRGKITGQILIVPGTIAYHAIPDKWKPELLSVEQNKDALILSKKSLELYREAYLGGKLENGFDPDFSPLLAPSFEGLPPAYIQIAGCDPLRDEGFLYNKILNEAGVTTRVDVYPGVPHGFHTLAPNFPLSKKQDADFRTAINWLLSMGKN
ncbi:hypothetical protein Clacol_007187 [Clathrus columnatus]|uniref:Alpha/beta hydrolase fold-3 domain-containing protein n=1 Tax=Clathrus columnatus TaxID=1419009 RepID=A0AAV5ALY6_9AGAM|nr:hypothetical protein Clacol_007187 [Clathrus columnatus]